MAGRLAVTRLAGHLSLECGSSAVRVLSSASGPYVLLGLPGGEVSLLATDQRALVRLGSACLKAAQQLRTARLQHDAIDDHPPPSGDGSMPVLPSASDEQAVRPDGPSDASSVPVDRPGVPQRPARPGWIRPELLADGQPEWLDVSTTARAVGVSRHTLNRWQHEGRGPSRTVIGPKSLYRRVDVLAWIGEPAAAIGTATTGEGVA